MLLSCRKFPVKRRITMKPQKKPKPNSKHTTRLANPALARWSLTDGLLVLSDFLAFSSVFQPCFLLRYRSACAVLEKQRLPLSFSTKRQSAVCSKRSSSAHLKAAQAGLIHLRPSPFISFHLLSSPLAPFISSHSIHLPFISSSSRT